MTAVMKEKKIWKYVTGTFTASTASAEDDQAAAGFILARVEFAQQDLVPADATAKDTWDTLCKVHEKGGPQAKLLAWTEVMDARYSEGDDMKEYIDTMREHNNRLASLQSKIDDEFLAAILLHSLNPSWSTTVQNISASPTLTFQSACVALIEEATRRKAELARGKQSMTTALYAGQSTFPPSSGSRGSPRTNITCTYCGKPGHTEERCFSKRDGKPPRGGGKAHVASSSSSSPTSRLHDMAYMATAHVTPGSTHGRDAWVLDTGAADHYCCRREWFTSFIPENSIVTVGGGGKLAIEGRGNVSIPAPPTGDSSSPSSYTWTNVAYVPSMGTNLLSVGYASETGHEPRFSGSHWEHLTIRSKDGKDIVAQGLRTTGRLYELVVATPAAFEAVACVAHGIESVERTVELWHQRLAHLNHQAVIDLFAKGMTADATGVATALSGASALPPPHCEACVLGKHKRSDIPTSVHHRATRPLYRVHLDLCGPMTPARDGSRYLMLVVDDCTRFTWMAALHSKDQAFDAFQRYVSLAEAEHSTRVCCVRSDNGGEFISKAFSAWLSGRGIRRELTTPHSPWQNGVVERMNRTIVEGGRTLLQAAQLPLSLWVLSSYATVYCRNRSPSSTLSDSTPYEAWYGAKPRHLHLRCFGCLAYAHIRMEDRTKFSPKAQAYTFVGYSLDSSAYLLWNGSEVIKSRDVHFVEHLFGHEAGQAQAGDVPQSVPLLAEDTMKDASRLLQPSAPAHYSVHPIDVPASSSSPSIPVPDSPPAQIPSPPSLAPLDAKAAARMKTLRRQLADTNTSGPADVAPSTVLHLAYIVHGQARITTNIGSDTPTYREATAGQHATEWKAATDSELASLVDAGTFTLCALPPGFKAIGGKWVLKIKRGAGGEIIKFKARFVAQGFLQRYGVDYVDTYAPVARIPSIRIIIALTAHHDWELHQMDVKSAYLNGDLEEEIYMHQPEGYAAPGKEQHVWKLNKSLYGLKQAGRTWHHKIDVALKRRGFTTLDADHCVYVRRRTDSVIIIALYVDDLLIASNNLADLTQFKSDLSSEFKMEDLGEATFILGVKIERDRVARTITIGQSAYVTALLDRHGMTDCKPVTAPMDLSSTVHQLVKAPEGHQTPQDETRDYQSIIGGIMFAMLCTRPDIAFAVTTLSQFASNPMPAHAQALKRVLRYLKGTINHSITYIGTGSVDSQPPLIGYSDADWAQSHDRRSVTGYAFLLCGGAISWQSKKQQTVALSTVEAEYMATTHAAKEAIWWRSVLGGLGYDVSIPTTLWSDSQGSISLAGNPEHHARTKHIDIQYHFIRQHLAEKTISLRFIGTEDMAADCLTKALERVRHEKGTRMLGMQRV
jgi:Reverse transcriptase (RNA-dependent DNA polymerase)/gag-polypeptide of LTR copia-type/Integrase core domain/GAG-pre-integrase domain